MIIDIWYEWLLAGITGVFASIGLVTIIVILALRFMGEYEEEENVYEEKIVTFKTNSSPH